MGKKSGLDPNFRTMNEKKSEIRNKRRVGVKINSC